MGTFSIWHWLILFLVIFVWAKPASVILRRLGFNGWWGLVAPIPVVNLIALWVIAYIDWPGHQKDSN